MEPRDQGGDHGEQDQGHQAHRRRHRRVRARRTPERPRQRVRHRVLRHQRDPNLLRGRTRGRRLPVQGVPGVGEHRGGGGEDVRRVHAGRAAAFRDCAGPGRRRAREDVADVSDLRRRADGRRCAVVLVGAPGGRGGDRGGVADER